MTEIVVSASSDALANGWTYNGTGANWYGEKQTQCGGKLCVVASASADLWAAMTSSEYSQERVGTHGPKSTSFPGHI